MYMRSPLFARSPATVDQGRRRAGAKKEGVDLAAIMNSTQADPSQTLACSARRPTRIRSGTTACAVSSRRTTRSRSTSRARKQHKELRKTFDNGRKLTGVSSYPAEAWIDNAGACAA
jgi:hypothetical protein